MEMIKTDIVIVGGGPAGLQAALSLGRIHRNAVLFDAGGYRNDPVTHSHNVLGHDGRAPKELREAGRRELLEYKTIRTFDVGVDSIERDGSEFLVNVADGSKVSSRAVILATGAVDDLSAVPGLQEIWGGRAAQCPFCHAHEFAGGRFALLGETYASHMVPMLEPVAGSVTVFATTNEIVGNSETSSYGPSVTRVREENDEVVIELDDNTEQRVDVVFHVPVARPRSNIASSLGAELNPSGFVRIDEFGATSAEGVFAAGDHAHLPALPMPNPSVVAAMAAGQMAAARATRYLITG